MNGGSVLYNHTGRTGDFRVAEVHFEQFRAILERHDRTWLNSGHIPKISPTNPQNLLKK